jgi:hypothetical protein
MTSTFRTSAVSVALVASMLNSPRGPQSPADAAPRIERLDPALDQLIAPDASV